MSAISSALISIDLTKTHSFLVSSAVFSLRTLISINATSLVIIASSTVLFLKVMFNLALV